MYLSLVVLLIEKLVRLHMLWFETFWDKYKVDQFQPNGVFVILNETELFTYFITIKGRYIGSVINHITITIITHYSRFMLNLVSNFSGQILPMTFFLCSLSAAHFSGTLCSFKFPFIQSSQVFRGLPLGLLPSISSSFALLSIWSGGSSFNMSVSSASWFLYLASNIFY